MPGRKHNMMFPGGLLSFKEPACQRRRWEASPRVRKTPGEGTAPHSGILAWEIPCTEEPGGLQPTWSQRARHNNKAEHVLSKRCFPPFWEVSEGGPGTVRKGQKPSANTVFRGGITLLKTPQDPVLPLLAV